MANVSGGRAANQVVDAPNKFLGAREVKVIAYSYSDDNAQRHVGIALNFGKDETDGKPLVAILLSPADMAEKLKLASPMVRDGIRSFLAGTAEVSAEDVPAHLMGGAPEAEETKPGRKKARA